MHEGGELGYSLVHAFGAAEVDGIPIEGTFRAHQVPLATVRENPEHLKILETWMRSYKPEELFDANGKFIAELAPTGNRRMGGNPHVKSADHWNK